MQAATAPPKPIRKPDPDLRTLQRQISFGSVSGFPAITSLKRKPMSQGMFSMNNIYKEKNQILYFLNVSNNSFQNPLKQKDSICDIQIQYGNESKRKKDVMTYTF